MQYKIARLLNTLFFIISAIIVVLWIITLLLVQSYSQFKGFYLAGAILISIGLLFFFVWLEQNWDKKIITKMAQEGKIALANIKGAKRLNFMRDSAFNKYWLYEFDAILYDKEHKAIQKTFTEKMRCDTDVIPSGSVYVTYDEEKPSQIFIIPNVLIGHLPELAPIAAAYEKDKKINVKYLDAFYNKGMVLRSFKEAVSEKLKSDANGEDKL